MRQLMIFAGLQFKRLFHKKSFIILLLLMPLVAFVLSLASCSETSLQTVGLVYNEKDSISKKFVEKELATKSSIFKYQAYTDAQTAVDKLKNKELDVVFVFRDDLTRRLEENVTEGAANHFMKMYVREETLVESMTAVNLLVDLYPDVISILYTDFITKETGLSASDAEKILNEYKGQWADSDIIEMKYIGNDSAYDSEAESAYITAPLRGLLACWIILLGMAANLYFLEDEKNGVLGLFSLKRRFTLSIISEIIPMLCGAVVAYLTMICLKITSFNISETTNLLLFVFAGAGFCALLKGITRTITNMGSIIPVIMIWMVIACPIFLAPKSLRILSFIFPVSHYIYAEGIPFFKLVMVAYGIVLILTSLLLYKKKTH